MLDFLGKVGFYSLIPLEVCSKIGNVKDCFLEEVIFETSEKERVPGIRQVEAQQVCDEILGAVPTAWIDQANPPRWEEDPGQEKSGTYWFTCLVFPNLRAVLKEGRGSTGPLVETLK